MERTLASLQICSEELHHHHLAKEEKAWDQIGLAHSFMFLSKHMSENTLYNIVIPIINSVTSVKLKKAGT